MQAKVLLISGNSVVVTIGGKSLIISKTSAMQAKIGSVVDVSEEDILTGTEYGLDWDIILPDGICVNSQIIQNALYAYGLFTLEDLKRNPNQVVAAVSSMLKLTTIELIKSAENALGGSE
jgi:hypothetical protein